MGEGRGSYPIKRKSTEIFKTNRILYDWTMDRYGRNSGVRFQSVGYELLPESSESDRRRFKSMSLRLRKEKQSANPGQSGGRVRPGDYGPQLKDCCKCIKSRRIHFPWP